MLTTLKVLYDMEGRILVTSETLVMRSA